MRIVFVGGGTGGHFYPLMAIAEAVASRSSSDATPEMYYIGPRRYDKEALERHGLTFIYCPAGKRRRYQSIRNVIDFFITGFGVFVALLRLFVLYPDVIMSKGGHTSIPIIFAGWFLRIPIVIHESDATPGRANAFAARFARYIAISYPETAQYFPEEKTALTGVPIRGAMFAPLEEEPGQDFDTDPDRKTVLVLGGSQGAERVNELILQTLDELLPYYNIIHQTGERALPVVEETARTLISDAELLSHYHLLAFMDAPKLHKALSLADVVVSRAGSGTIHEIAIHGKPSILIPIPEDVSHDQRSNAYAYARSGAASVLEEKNLKDGLLEAEIRRIMDDQQIYEEMGAAAHTFAPHNAADTIADALYTIGKEHE